MSLIVIPSFAGTCPNATAVDFFRHQIAYERTEETGEFKGLRLIHTDVSVRGSITGFYIREELKEFNNPSLRDTYLFGKDGLQGGGTCTVGENWRQCIEKFTYGENAGEPVATCNMTIDLRTIPAWTPSPNDQRKKRIAGELRSEIEARYQNAQDIVIRDFNLAAYSARRR